MSGSIAARFIGWSIVVSIAIAMTGVAPVRAGGPDAPAKKPAGQQPGAKQGAAKKPANLGPDIYDRIADGEKQVAAAVAEAKRDHKRVLLQFGANWCVWCHRLHDLCATNKDIAHELLYEYAVVHVDVDKVDGKPHNQTVVERYGNPTKLGLPALVVLDEDGKNLVTQDSGKLEAGDHHDPAKVLAFLKQWEATPPTADAALAAGVSRAKAESKAVFVDFSAPWCVWCRRLDEYLHRPKIAAVFEPAFVGVKIDIDRYKGGKELLSKYGGAQAGLPFYVLLDGSGKKVADCIGPGGNIGFPSDDGIPFFMKMLRKAAPRLSDAQIAVMEEGLKEKAVAGGH